MLTTAAGIALISIIPSIPSSDNIPNIPDINDAQLVHKLMQQEKQIQQKAIKLEQKVKQLKKQQKPSSPENAGPPLPEPIAPKSLTPPSYHPYDKQLLNLKDTPNHDLLWQLNNMMNQNITMTVEDIIIIILIAALILIFFITPTHSSFQSMNDKIAALYAILPGYFTSNKHRSFLGKLVHPHHNAQEPDSKTIVKPPFIAVIKMRYIGKSTSAAIPVFDRLIITYNNYLSFTLRGDQITFLVKALEGASKYNNIARLEQKALIPDSNIEVCIGPAEGAYSAVYLRDIGRDNSTGNNLIIAHSLSESMYRSDMLKAIIDKYPIYRDYLASSNKEE